MGKTIGLYLHVPFCAVKCPYCDFYSRPYRGSEAEAYTASLISALLAYQGRELQADSLYFGGGTPSLLSPTQVKGLVRAAEEAFSFSGEATMEMNPNTINLDRLQGYREGGINRVSFGVQSLRAEELAALGRRHTVQQALSAVELAKRAGFDDISIDLMLGVPRQTLQSLHETLTALAGLPVTHVSAYLLKVEEGTPYEKSPLLAECPGEDELAELYLLACEGLCGMGLMQYEISNFARPGRESRHNLKYWRCEEYLGFGPAAHSFLDGRRLAYPPSLERWLAGDKPELTDAKAGSVTERMMLGLRLTEGIPSSLPGSLRDAEQAEFWRKAGQLERAGLLLLSKGRIALTRRGFLVSNSLLAELLPEF